MLIKCISNKFHGNPICLRVVHGNRRTNMTNLIYKLLNYSLRPLLGERRGIMKFQIIISVAPRSVYALVCVWFRNEDKSVGLFMSLFLWSSCVPQTGQKEKSKREKHYML
jgi:hypothetical protein